jgi:hypothetical protein
VNLGSNLWEATGAITQLFPLIFSTDRYIACITCSTVQNLMLRRGSFAFGYRLKPQFPRLPCHKVLLRPFLMAACMSCSAGGGALVMKCRRFSRTAARAWCPRIAREYAALTVWPAGTTCGEWHCRYDHSQLHFDLSGFLASFLRMWRTWMALYSFDYRCSSGPYARAQVLTRAVTWRKDASPSFWCSSRWSLACATFALQ